MQVLRPAKLKKRWALLDKTLAPLMYGCISLGYGVRFDSHHRIPQSRCKKFGIDPECRNNRLRLPRLQHGAWHALFGNMVAEEVLSLIVNQGWRPTTTGQRAAWRLIFPGNPSTEKIIWLLENKWSIRNHNKTAYRKMMKQLKAKKAQSNGLGNFLFTIKFSDSF